MRHYKRVRRAWERFVSGEAVPAEINHTVLASWQRSRDHNVTIEREMAPLVREPEFYRRRSECLTLVNAARAAMDPSSAFLNEANAMMILTDASGLVMETKGDARVIDLGRSIHLEFGGRWSEADIGTNAIGTAMAEGQPVQIHGAEHFCSEIQRWTCAATPVRHPVDGELLGILDISGPASTFVPQSLALAVAVGHHIEELLTKTVMRDRERLLQYSLARASRWRNDDVIVVDSRGTIVHATDRALLAARSGLSGDPDASAIPVLKTVPLRAWPVALGGILPYAAVELVTDEGSDIGAIIALRPRRAAADRVRPQRVDKCAPRPAKPMMARGDGPLNRRGGAPDFVTDDPRVRAIVHQVEATAARIMPILILGETGTGKERLARHAHIASGRTGAFVPVNCAALPQGLIEAELFGYAEGAFTGARRGGAIGLVREADGGTLFLDEIGDMPTASQAVLLRFLDDWTVRPVGGGSVKVDVLLISATNTRLDRAVAQGRFRSDLLYRLNTLEVTLPPLADRGDFEMLVRHLLRTLDPQFAIAPAAIARLARCPWPGNIRQLRAALARMTLTAETNVIDEAALEATCGPQPDSGLRSADASNSLQTLHNTHIFAAYEAAKGNVSEAARRLGISRNTVYRALRLNPPG